MKQNESKGVVLIEPTILYNILQQNKFYPCLSDPNYLILLDLRKESEYNESHIITARKPPKATDGSYSIPYASEIECKKHVIVYDSNTNKLDDMEVPVLKYAKFLWDEGSRNPVKVLTGGYERFSALYPYLRTLKVLYTIRELDEIPTYPYEIFHGELYLGTNKHAALAHIQKELNLTAHICCTHREPPKNKRIVSQLHISHLDQSSTDLYPYFQTSCDFIDNAKNVLIYSDSGVSRSVTILLAYLIKSKQYSLKDAYSFVKDCCQFIRPLCTFMTQLCKWEADINKIDEPISEENAPEIVVEAIGDDDIIIEFD